VSEPVLPPLQPINLIHGMSEGDRVTVRDGRRDVVHAIVARVHPGAIVISTAGVVLGDPGWVLGAHDEGVRWARGWEGKAVDALKTAIALGDGT
jgi:hypothetical protein